MKQIYVASHSSFEYKTVYVFTVLESKQGRQGEGWLAGTYCSNQGKLVYYECFCIPEGRNAPVAQRIERLASNQKVGGSIPSGRTKEGRGMWFVYMVECADGSLYTGIARDVVRRIATHNSGKGAKYTATRTPVKLVWQEASETRSTDSQREAAIKQLTRSQKLQLINELGIRHGPVAQR